MNDCIVGVKGVFLPLVLVTVIMAGCSKPVPEPEVHYKYTIWVGSSVFASGYDTNSYEITDSGIKFKTTKGKTKIVPKSSLYSIDEN